MDFLKNSNKQNSRFIWATVILCVNIPKSWEKPAIRSKCHRFDKCIQAKSTRVLFHSLNITLRMNAKKIKHIYVCVRERPFLRYVSHATPLLGPQWVWSLCCTYRKKVYMLEKMYSCTQNVAPLHAACVRKLWKFIFLDLRLFFLKMRKNSFIVFSFFFINMV